MDNSKIVFLINDSARAIEAKYEEGGVTETFKTMDQSIAIGDMAVVQSGTRHGMTVVKVTSVDVDVNFDNAVSIKWVVQKINKPAFDQILDKEGEAISAVQAAELRRKKAELRKNMFADHEESISRLALTSRDEADPTVTE